MSLRDLRAPLAALVTLAAALGAPGAARAADGAPADSGAVADSSATPAAPADSVAADGRTLLSTDGAIRVYEEAQPGEGIEGFWWEYDPIADLVRLLDDEQRSRPLEPLTDAFGFNISVPETILALRDSVRAVADSILAERIETLVKFDPRLNTRYREQKDSFLFENSVEASLPLGRRGSVTTNVKDTNDFNESTKVSRDNQNLSAAFNYRFRDALTSSLTATRSVTENRRGGDIQTESVANGVNGRLRADRTLRWVGRVEPSVGLAVNRNEYNTAITDGIDNKLSPTWGIKTTTGIAAGTLVNDYSGSLAFGTREETRTTFAVIDSVPTQIEDRTTADETNYSSRFTSGWDGEVAPETTLRLNGGLSLDRQQYISQVDSLLGRPETRTIRSRNAKAAVRTKPLDNLEFRDVSVELSDSERDFDLDTIRATRTARIAARLDMDYDPWKDGQFTIRLDRTRTDNDYETIQAGLVDERKAQVDFDQKVTSHVSLKSGYLISVDSRQFDDTEANTNDRDFRTQRGTFDVRYTPFLAFSSAVRMEIRQQESVNIHPSKSGDNKTDYTYIITPTYSLKVGASSFVGDFTADAKYAVFDFDEDRNTLTRRFSTHHNWKQALSPRLSTELDARYEYSDEGSYRRRIPSEPRLYFRSREIRRFNVETKVLWNPTTRLRTIVSYRLYGDDQYSVSGTDRVRTDRPRTQELSAGFRIRQPISEHASFDLDLTHTRKDGDRITDTERRYFVIIASLEYQPFKRPSTAGGGGDGS